MTSLQFERGRIAAEEGGRTSARVVPVVVNSSGRYERAEDLAALWAAFIALGTILAFFLYFRVDDQPFEPQNVQRMSLLPELVAITAGFGCGTLIVTQMFWIRRLFVPRRTLARNVDARASQAFNEHRLRDRTRPAVLVLVSIYERMCRIIADESLLVHLPADRLDSLQKTIEQSIGGNHFDSALPAALAEIAQLVKAYEPARQDAPPVTAAAA